MVSPIFPHLAKPLKLIVLDRDGVINEDSDAFVKTVDEWIPIPGSLEAIARLCQAGWTVAVATNQSGLARGLFDFSTLGDMHFKMQQLVMEQGGRIDLIVHCPHGPDDGCDCRKPQPGLFRRIAEHFHLPNLNGVPVVGDSIATCTRACCSAASPTWFAPARASARSRARCRRGPRSSTTSRRSPIT